MQDKEQFLQDINQGYVFLKPKEDKYYKSRDIRFNQKLFFVDKYGNNSIEGWISSFDEVNKDN